MKLPKPSAGPGKLAISSTAPEYRNLPGHVGIPVLSELPTVWDTGGIVAIVGGTQLLPTFRYYVWTGAGEGSAFLEVERIVVGKTVAPAVTDDLNAGYRVGTLWIDETGDTAYISVDHTVGAAVWREIYNAPVTLAADADTLLGLTGQQLTLDAQAAFTVLAGPAAAGPDADPTFRALVDGDIPAGIMRDAEHTAIGDASPHHAAVTLGAGSDAALALAGQELTLADVLTPTEHVAIGDASPHHAAVTLGVGSDAALTLAGQELTLADVLTPTEHTAIGDGAPHHAAVTLAADADTLLGLSAQALTLDTQVANRIFAGPGSGADADPTFRAMVAADIPVALRTHLIFAWIDPTSPSTTVAKVVVGPMPFAGSFVKVTLKCKEGETNGATAQLVDIHLQTAANENTDTTATIWSTQGNRPTITNTNKAGNTTVFNTTGFAKGDWFYIYSDQLGTTLTALAVGIEVQQTS